MTPDSIASRKVLASNPQNRGSWARLVVPSILCVLAAVAPVHSATISTVASGLQYPHGAITDVAGNTYIADTDNNCVKKLTPGGALTLYAGTCAGGFSGDGGPATSAQLNGPYGLALDSVGNLFIADRINRRIRKVAPNGTIATVAGNGIAGFSGDGGAAITAQLGDPVGLAVDSSDRLYIADLSNQRVRRIANGIIETYAGNGTAGYSGDGGPAQNATFNQPAFLAMDLANNLYVADRLNGAIRKVTPAGSISTVMGVNYPDGVAVGADGTVYASDRYGYRVRAIDATGASFVFAGTGVAGYSGDGGVPTSAALNQPTGLFATQKGDLLIGDTYNHAIRKVSGLSLSTSCGAPVTGVTLSDRFPGSSVDTSKWNVYGVGAGGAINVTPGTAVFNVSGDVLAIQSASNPIPATGDFSIYCKGKIYASNPSHGAICATHGSAIPTYPGYVTKTIWQVAARYGAMSDYMDAWMNPGYQSLFTDNFVADINTTHEYELCVKGNTVERFRDGVSLGSATLPQGWVRPEYVSIGNPGSPGAPFTSLEVNAIEVRLLQSPAVNGTCGTANGTVSIFPPTANRCATGTPNPAVLLGVGPWSWTCDGISGGTNVPCSASQPPEQTAASINPSASGTRTHADPIIVASGAHSISLPLLNVQGRVPLGFAISYSSLSPTTDTGVGFGWTHRYGATLIRIDSATAAVQWPSGRVTQYKKAGVTWYPQSADANDKLVENVDGSWALTDAALTKHEFSSVGALQKQTSRSGVVLNFTYAAGKLTTVTDPVSGRSVSFTWNAGNRIASVTAPGGQSAQLAYDAAGNLVSATNGAGGTVTYTYDASHRVLTGANELGEQFFANTYDAQGRVIGQDDGVIASPTTGLAYTSSAGGVKTVVTDRNAKSATYEFDAQYRETKATDATGAAVSKTYDVNGNVLTQTDANGKVTTTTYDARNNPLTVTDAAGRTVTMTYDSNDNMLTLTDAAGSTTTFTYDASNRLLTRKNALNQTTTYAYNANGQVTQVTLPSGATITSTYAAGQLATMTDATGNTTGFAYNANGQVTSVTDATGGVTTFTYDGMGRVLTTTNPLRHVVTNAYDARGRLLTRTDARGNATTYAYNANDKPVSITNALGQITTMTYDNEDRVTGVTDARGNTTTFAYNARGDQTTITDALGRAVTKTIDPAGIVTAITNGAGNTASFTFDNSYALATSADGLANTTTLTRDTAARVTRSTDPLGRQTNFTYDALSRLASTTDALAGVASQSFDTNGNLASMTDQRGNTTSFAFDAQGRMLSITTPEGSVVSSTYTPRGQFSTITNARGQVATFTYDVAGRVTQRSDAAGTITYTYDENGNPLTVSDSVGTITRVFDALNRVTSYTTAHGKTMDYQYDTAGNLTRITYPDGKQVNYTYNAANQMATVTDWANRMTTYGYDTAGRLNAITNSNGTTVSMTYDAAGRLTAYTDTVNANSYVYDAAGNLTKEVNPNLAAPPVGKITMTYDNANRIVTFNGTAVTYDADGNMTYGPVGPLGAPVFANFTWDSRNRLLSVTGGNAYVYDAENHRIQAGTTRYVINPHVRLSQVLMETNTSGIPTAWYVYGLGLIGREDASGYKTYHYDRRGSTVALSGGGGVVTDTYKYAAYGELVNHTGTAVQPFAYAGRDGVMDEGYGLSFARARYSSASTRRFLSRDTLMGSIASPATLNQFTLLDGSPMSGGDPTGMLSWSDFGNFASGMLDTASFVVKGVATVGICGSIGWNVGAGACVSTGAAALADLNDGAAKLGSVLDNVVIGVGQSADALLGTDAWTSVSDVTPDQTDYLGALGGSNSVIGKSLYVAMKANQMGHNLKDIYKGVRDVNLRQTWAQVKSLTSLNWHYATHGVVHLLDTYSDYARVLDNVKAATWDVYTTGADGLDLGRYLFGGAGVRQPSTSTGVGSTMPICMQFSLSPHCSGKKGG